jgi:CitMHS family citrate-Mg2+:H+ or citrate-Ca2+:H+ symporter
MFLSILGFLMIATFMYLIMSKRLSAMIALILIPVVFALIGGFSSELGNLMLSGVKSIAPTGVMLVFGILYFGIMIDAGLFDPVVEKTLKAVKGDPVKIVVGTALLALLVSLDGDGSTTYMIVISAMLPLYLRLGMNPLVLTAVTMLSSGVMNIIERKRLGLSYESLSKEEEIASFRIAATLEVPEHKRPKLLWVNFALTAVLIVSLVMNILPIPVLFMIAFALAMMINYPSLEEQKERMSAHAGNALAVAGMVFAAGIFTGILTGTKMVDAMANTLVALIPDALGPHMPIFTAIISMPFTFFMSNDAFYFGILPLITKATAIYGIDASNMARASLLGQPVHLLSPLVPSTYLLVGLAGVNFGDHQRFTLKWAIGTTIVMLITALVIGIIAF